VSGGFIAQPVVIAWAQNNAAGHYKKSVSSAMMIGFGNCGGIIASNIYITGEKPRYPTGFGVSLGLLWVCDGRINAETQVSEILGWRVRTATILVMTTPTSGILSRETILAGVNMVDGVSTG
jgi:hypothetical protein